MIVMLIGASLIMASCTDDGEEAEIDDGAVEKMIFALELESDSVSGNEWTVEQDDVLFDEEDVFLENEGDENGTEIQSFVLTPLKPGTVTVKFINESTATTYTYECTISEEMDEITVNSSAGEAGGAEVEAPEPMLERN